MARKHNTKHNRSQSNYPARLRARGLTSVSVRMPSLTDLRKRQGYTPPEDEGMYWPSKADLAW